MDEASKDRDGWYALADDPRDDLAFVRMLEQEGQLYEGLGWPDESGQTVIYMQSDAVEGRGTSSGLATVGDSELNLEQAVGFFAQLLARLADARPGLSGAVPANSVESPYLTKEEAAPYMRTSVDGIYGRIERGQLEKCPGVREYLFTKEMLDDAMMGRVEKPGSRNRKGRGGGNDVQDRSLRPE